MNLEKPLSQIIKAVLFSSNKPVNMKQLMALFPEDACPSKDVIETSIEDISQSLEGDVMELRKLASGYAIQIRQEFADWVGKLVEEKPPRYSRAVLETIAIIAYRQPITRSEIEEIRGIAVNTVMVKTLVERDWIRVIGHKDVPGKPAIYGTTQHFLDYFNLESLTDLPPIGDIKELTDEEILKIEAILDENQQETLDIEGALQAAESELASDGAVVEELLLEEDAAEHGEVSEVEIDLIEEEYELPQEEDAAEHDEVSEAEVDLIEEENELPQEEVAAEHDDVAEEEMETSLVTDEVEESVNE